MAKPFHVYQIFIRASAEQVWQAITDPEFTKQYFFQTRFESSLEPASGYRYVMADGADAVEGTIVEVETNRRLVMTWRALYDPALADEPPSRVEWVLTPGDGVTKLTTIHSDLAFSPATSADVEEGWVWLLDSMKTLVETGTALQGGPPEPTAESGAAASAEEAAAKEHRRQGVDAHNATFELLDGRVLSTDEIDDVLARAYASTYHWHRASGRKPENAARGSWLVSHVHAVLGQGDLARHHAEQCARVVAANGLTDFDLAYAHEAKARALACLGRLDDAGIELAAARAVPIAKDEDAKILTGDIDAGPWYGLDA